MGSLTQIRRIPILNMLLLSLVSLAVVSCGSSPELDPEPWASEPVQEWPPLVLTSEVHFIDTVYHGLANAFLLDLGEDTVAVTAKHILLFLAEERELETVHLGPEFVRWDLYAPKGEGVGIRDVRLINEDPDEPIGTFNTLKVRDWLLFEVDASEAGVVPLRIRPTILKKGQIAYAVGRSQAERMNPVPTVIPLRVFENVGPYYYVRSLDPDADPEGTSGSPVIDEGGHLVGIVSGASGNLGVVCSLEYLRQVLQRRGLRRPAP